jgi:hypothetical protein
MYNLAIKLFCSQIEKIGDKIILARSLKRIKQELRAPTYRDLYRYPEKYKNKILF